MKVELLCLDSANKPSPMSEGVTEIRINSQPCKGIVTPTFYKNKNFVQIGVQIKMHIKL
jgi:hypothetical protein